MRSSSESNLNRRAFLKAAASIALTAPSAGLAAAPARSATPATPSLIRQENARPGADDWQLTRVRVDQKSGRKDFRAFFVEGYCSRQSVRAGESIDIMVSTNPPSRFMIEVFRTGYYAGRGARLLTTIGPLKGQTQPDPTVGPKRVRECRWETSVSLTIPSDWPSGVYLGRLTTVLDDIGHP